MTRRTILSLFACSLLVSVPLAQETALDWYRKAEAYYEAGKYAESADAYDASIAAGASQPTTYYNAACASALAGRADAAFRWLDEAIARGWWDADHTRADEDLASLHGDERWAVTLQKCAQARETFLASLQQPQLYLELMEMKRVDQEYRSSMHVLPAPKDASAGNGSGHGHRDDGHDHGHGDGHDHGGDHAHEGAHAHDGEHAHGMNVDERHTARMKEIVKQYGWPTNSMVGSDGATAAWLLVQHADHDPKFQRYCLELMKKVPKGEVSTVDLAYLTDRVLVNEGKKQLYGTQFWLQNGELVPRPIEDEANLEKRRKEAGMISFAEYERHMAGPHDH